jgi:biopolymer transport protein ExbD
MRRHARPKPDSGIDVSPLIDMVFILLIFFMVTTTFVKDAKVEIERPSAQSATSASSKSLRVSIDAGGAVYLDGVEVKPWMLQSRVRDLLRAATEKTVLVVTDRRVVAERLIEVVDQLRLAGATDVGVATIREAGG